MRGLKIWIAGLTGILTLPAAGVIRHPADDLVDFSKPDAAVIGLWNTNASAVAIGPNHAITTRHQGGGLTSTITFGGTTYDVAEIHNIGNVDLRVVRLETGGNPANLAQWVDVFDGNDNLHQDFVMGGYGKIRGSELTTTNGTYGYLWGAGPTAVPQWGQNRIETIGNINAGAFTSAVLGGDFDRPGEGLPAEAILSEYDSGGGWLVWTGSEWQVRALSAYLFHTSPNDNLDDDRALFASHLDANVDAPDLMYGIRLASYYDDIYQVIPEPSSALLLALGASSLMIRRRPSA